AVVVLKPTSITEADYRLQLLDLDPNNFGGSASDEPLWTGTLKLPVLATAPRGRHIAVAGNSSHEILVYSVQELLNHRGEAQRLRGMGDTFGSAAFVKKDKGIGIVLKKTAGNAAENTRPVGHSDLIFDIGKRRLTDDEAGWEPNAPSLENWHVSQP